VGLLKNESRALQGKFSATRTAERIISSFCPVNIIYETGVSTSDAHLQQVTPDFIIRSCGCSKYIYRETRTFISIISHFRCDSIPIHSLYHEKEKINKWPYY
jgi:hypothetical protein